jgi:hypothetical protein
VGEAERRAAQVITDARAEVVEAQRKAEDAALTEAEAWGTLAEAQGGAAWFSLALKNGAVERAYECRFVEMPAGTPTGGGFWRVSASLEYRGLA